MMLILVVLASQWALALGQGNLGPCDPLVPALCAYPWPNDFWLREDASSATGYRLNVTAATMPADTQGRRFETDDWNTLDGFSASSAAHAFLGDVDLEPLPHHWDMARSMDADCPSILLDTVTGERVPHFVELDESSPLGDGNKTIMLWPSRRLEDARRYIVAYRNLQLASGEAVEPSEVFRALRDGLPSDDPTVEPRRAHFEDIFARLAAAGFGRASLVLAWDYTTASLESISGRLVAARDDALARIPAGGPAYRVTGIQDEYSANVYRRIDGVVIVPSYMSGLGANTTLVLDPDTGLPTYQEDSEVEFTVLIPRSVVDSGQPGAILQYGHGLLGTREEVIQEYLQEIANRWSYVLVAVNWLGMSREDIWAIVGVMLIDVGRFPIIPDRTTQGIVGTLFAMRLMQGNFATDPAATVINGRPTIDPTRRYYYGNSQGGILGINYMAASTDVERGCVGVPGAPFGLLLARSFDFSPFYLILKYRYTGTLERAFLITFMDSLWERAAASGYLNAVTGTPLPNTPRKRLLIQYSLGDAQVSYLGSYFMVRSTDARFFTNNVAELNETLYDFAWADGPVSDGSIGVGYDYGVPAAPRENRPPQYSLDTHEYVRREARAQDQMHSFFSTGVIPDPCNGQGCYGTVPTQVPPAAPIV